MTPPAESRVLLSADATPRELYAGVMSGTSLDGVDAVVADFSSAPMRTLGAAHQSMPDALRSELLALQTPGHDEIARAARASVALADLYADSIVAACKAAHIDRADLIAAGVHGQTIRHRPDEGWTVQLNNAARVAERAGVVIVADFRSRDIAAGGQGAPLTPAFHAAMFATPDHSRAILNLGGIANLTLMEPGKPVRGFDTGPANVLIDYWHQRHRSAPVDRDGAWAATGTVNAKLLEALLDDDYFRMRVPKSTGRDRFHPQWLEVALRRRGAAVAPADVQATLVELTAASIADAMRREAPDVADVVACGGGVHNATLMDALRRHVAPRKLLTTASLGVEADHVEALAFAWLARETIAHRAGNLPSVTGAQGPRVLGGVYFR